MGNCDSRQNESESDQNRERDRDRRKRRHRRRQTKLVKKAHGKCPNSQGEGWETDRGGGPSQPSMTGALPADTRDIELQPMPSNVTSIPPASEYPTEETDKSTSKGKGKQKAVIDSRPPVSESGRSNSTRHRHHRSGRSRSRSVSGQAESSGHRRGSHQESSHHSSHHFEHRHHRTHATDTQHRGRGDFAQASTTLLPGQIQSLPPVSPEGRQDPTPSILNHKTGPVVHPQADTEDDPYGGDPPTYHAQESSYPHIHTPTPVSGTGIALPPWVDMRTDSSEVSGK